MVSDDRLPPDFSQLRAAVIARSLEYKYVTIGKYCRDKTDLKKGYEKY